jgi:hypothetical protein
VNAASVSVKTFCYLVIIKIFYTPIESNCVPYVPGLGSLNGTNCVCNKNTLLMSLVKVVLRKKERNEKHSCCKQNKVCLDRDLVHLVR